VAKKLNPEQVSGLVLENALLEILHVVSHDGAYSDLEFIEQELKRAGVSQEQIDYHKKH